MRTSTLEVIAIVLFIVGIVLFTWKIFGDSPTDLAVLIPFLLTIIFKVWSADTRLTKLEVRFNHLGKDFKEYKERKH
ncbi:hypothetical protein J4207_06340 [Candidatus Woesearchaeota archaeon]|nr:hypothetical protein [Candidatus Woesearchaeota archaeon]